jgi:hypothetical protein
MDAPWACTLGIQLFYQCADFLDDQRAQPFRRLIHEEDVRILDKGPRDREHLLLSAGERIAARIATRMETRECLIDARGRPRSGPRPCWSQLDVLHDRQGWENPMPLRHPAYAAGHDIEGGQIRNHLATKMDRATTWSRNAEDSLQRRGLADAIAAENADNLAWEHVERDAVQDVAFAIERVYAVEGEQRRRGHATFPM